MSVNRLYVTRLSRAWVRDPASEAARGWPVKNGPELVTSGSHGAFWPLRQRVANGLLHPIYDGPDGFVVPISLVWLAAFLEEICPDRDTPYANHEVWDVWEFLDTAKDDGRWAIVGRWH